MTRIRAVAAIVWLGMLRRKDMYVMLLLLGALLAVLVSLDIFGLGGAVGYVKDIGLLMAWVFSAILTVTVSTRELPQEEARGTVFPLLAKPISRFELIAGKWLGCWSIAAAATMAFYLLVATIVGSKGGGFDLTTLAQGFALHACALGILAGIGLLFSCRLNQDAAAALTYIAAAVSALVVPKVPQLAVAASGPAGWALTAVYHLMPHFELFDMRTRLVHDFGPVRWGTFCAAAAYGVCLTLAFVLLAWLAYRRKRFARGDMGM